MDDPLSAVDANVGRHLFNEYEISILYLLSISIWFSVLPGISRLRIEVAILFSLSTRSLRLIKL